MPAFPRFFDAQWYLVAHPDVASGGGDPRRHYLRHGRREGRRPCALTAADRERDLRHGLLRDGAATLEAMAQDAALPEAERVWARLALARAAARASDWAGAAGWLDPLDPARDIIDGFGLIDPVLLAAEAAIATGDTARARRLLRRAGRRFGSRRDLALSLANLRATEGGFGFGLGWRAALTRLYAPAGLAVPRVAPGAGPAFDRLAARTGRRSRSGPLVSVVMPARDAAATIGAALDALSAQSWQALEVLVVDNGSTDATATVVRDRAARDPRIRLIDGAIEPGAYAARNLGAAQAQGDFLTVHDADDWSHPAKIALQVRALMARPEAMASQSHWVRATPDLRFTRWWGERGLVHPNISSLMIRAEVLERLGYWDRARAGADTEYADRIRAAFGAGAVIEVRPGLPLAFGRSHASSLSGGGTAGIDSMWGGARRDYHMAAAAWHTRATTGGPEALHLPRKPRNRPFPVPPALDIGDPAPKATDPAHSPAERLRASPGFDAAWRLRSLPELRLTGGDPALQWLAEGAAQAEDPGPFFSASGALLAGWRESGVLPEPAAPALLDRLEAQARDLPDLDGALPAPRADAPGVLFVGHQAGSRIFGAERSLLDMLDRARVAGMTPSLVLPQILNAEYLRAVLARVHRLHLRPLGWLYGGVDPDPSSVALLADLVRATGATALHQNTCVMDAPLLAARAAGVPAVVWPRELPAQDPRLCRDLGVRPEELRRRVLDLSERVVANSEAVARWIDAPKKTTVVPNSVDPALHDMPFEPQTPLRVALIGSLSAEKGVADAAAVARVLARRGAAARVVLIGPRSAAVAALGRLPKGLSHAGYAASPVEAMAGADLVLSLSRFAESFGRTVLEAMAAGRPVVCYDRGTPPELVGRDGRAGIVVPADDAAAVAAAIADIAGDPARLEAMSQAARARAQTLRTQPEDTSYCGVFTPRITLPNV